MDVVHSFIGIPLAHNGLKSERIIVNNLISPYLTKRFTQVLVSNPINCKS